MSLQRLLCINNKPLPDTHNTEQMLSVIEEGETYYGHQQLVYTPSGKIKLGWCIPSISIERGYALERFIPCSDTPAEVIEETELVTA